MVSTTIDPRTLCTYTGQCEYSIENGFKRDNKIFDNDYVRIECPIKQNQDMTNEDLTGSKCFFFCRYK